MKKNRIKIGLTLFIVASMIMMSPSLVESQARPGIKIGAIGPLAITTGKDMKQGAELAVKEINAGAGVDIDGTAHDIDLLVETTSGSDGLPDATFAAISVDKLIVTDEVGAMLGGFRTEVMLGEVQPKINASKVPFLGVGSTSPLLSEYYYRAGPTNGTTLVRNILGLYLTYMATKGVTDVVVVREDAQWTPGLSGAITSKLAIGALLGSINFTIHPEIKISQKAAGSEVASALQPLTTNTDLDAIITLFSAPVGRVVSEQWAALGLNDDVYLAGINVEAQKSDHFLATEGGAAGEIFLDTAPANYDTTNKTGAFKTAYFAEYNEVPTYTSFAAYDSVYILKDAMERSALVAGDMTDAATVRAAIHGMLPSTHYTGAAAEYKFTSENNWGQIAAYTPLYDIWNNTIVHDLSTPSSVGVNGEPYSQPFFGQWLENNTQVVIFGGSATGFTPLISPPYVGVVPTDTPVVSTIVTTVDGTEITIVSTQEDTITETDTKDEGLPGFELYLSMTSIFFITLYISRNRRRKD